MSKLTPLKTIRRSRGVPGDRTPAVELGLAMVAKYLPPPILDRILDPGERPCAAILVAPTNEHLEVVISGLCALCPSGAVDVVAIRGQFAESTTTILRRGIAPGRSVVVVCTDLGNVPIPFRMLAEETITLGFHDLPMVKRVIQRMTGRAAPAFPDDFVLHPNPALVCGCIVPELPVEQVMVALARLGKEVGPVNREALPPLDQCVEYGEAREWGLAIMRDIAAWQRGELPAADLDTSALLVSPPGCGKTHFARILADSMGVELFSMTEGGLFEGDGNLSDVLQALREKFAEATAAAPAVLLLDEMDGFGRRDAADHNRAFVASVVNELLTLLDGASQRRAGLIVIGATNLPDLIDPALLRPGRLSRRIDIGLPDAAGVEHILRVHLRESLIDEPLDDVIRLAIGATPARLAECIRNARRAARDQRRPLAITDLTSALVGERLPDSEVAYRLALHEAGHALVAMVLPDAPYLKAITLVAEGANLGRVMTVDQPGANTRARIEAKVKVLLAGRAAEDLFHANEPSDGATRDLDGATRLLLAMHAQMGMGGQLLHLREADKVLAIDRDLRRVVEADLQRLFVEVVSLLNEHRTHLMALTEELLNKTVMTAEEAAQVVELAEEARLAASTTMPITRAREIVT